MVTGLVDNRWRKAELEMRKTVVVVVVVVGVDLLLEQCNATSRVRFLKSKITSENGVVVDNGKRRKDWNQSFGRDAILSQFGESWQLVFIEFVEIVPAEAIDKYH